MILGKRTGFIAVFILCLLSFTDLLYPSKGEDVNRIVPQVGRALFFLIMVVTIFQSRVKHGKYKLSIVSKAILYLFFMITFFYLWDLENVPKNLMDFIKIIYWMIGFFYLRILFKFNYLSHKQMEILIGVSIVIYFLIVIRDSSSEALMWGSRFYAVSNNGYNLLRFFPVLLLMRKKTIKNVLLVLIAFGVVLSFKRGVIVAFAVGFIVYYITIITNRKRRRFVDLLAGVIVLGAAFYFIQDQIDVIEHRMRDFQSIKTAGSGRGNMYSLILEQMFVINSDVMPLLFGHGIYATKEFFGTTIRHYIVAHSDVLEMLYDFGVLGIALFVNFFRSIFKLYKRHKGSIESVALLVWFVTIGFSSMYSVNLFSPEMIYSILLIAYVDAKGSLLTSKKVA